MSWLLLWLACGDPAPATVVVEVPPACTTRTDEEITKQGPFAVEAGLEGTTLRASLRNQAPLVRSALHHEAAQPSTVVLLGANGAVVAPQDTRREKDTALVPVTKDRWARLEPCEVLPLGEGTFAKEGAAYTFAWGPYTWKRLPAGAYTARVVLPMQLAHYNDPLGSRHKVDDSWNGDVQSEPVGIVLP